MTMTTTNPNHGRLIRGEHYDAAALRLVGWARCGVLLAGAEDAAIRDTYSVWDYLPDGIYLGADTDGIEPVVEVIDA